MSVPSAQQLLSIVSERQPWYMRADKLWIPVLHSAAAAESPAAPGSVLYMWDICPSSVLASHPFRHLHSLSFHPPFDVLPSFTPPPPLLHSVPAFPVHLSVCSLCPYVLVCASRCPRWAFCRAVAAGGMSGAHRVQGRRTWMWMCWCHAWRTRRDETCCNTFFAAAAASWCSKILEARRTSW